MKAFKISKGLDWKVSFHTCAIVHFTTMKLPIYQLAQTQAVISHKNIGGYKFDSNQI